MTRATDSEELRGRITAQDIGLGETSQRKCHLSRPFLKGYRRLGQVGKGQKEPFNQRKGTVSSKDKGSPGLGATLRWEDPS